MASVPGLDDRELSEHIRAAAAGSAASVARIVERFTPCLLAQADHRLGASLRRFADPADVVSAVWIIALRRLPEFDPQPGAAARTWLRFLGTILLRQVRDLYEKHLGGKPVAASPGGEPGVPDSGAGLPDDTTGIVTRAVRAERAEALRDAIAALEPLDRAVVVLRAIEGQTNDIVAASTGLAPNTVSVRLRRALTKLRERLPASCLADLAEE
jgi:RNA polymerase sigma factor (sigma-70 family)